MSFERALAAVLEAEGGYVFHPSDKGGPTNKGITQTVYDTWRMTHAKPTRSVREIDDMEIAAIYRTQYWRPAGCDHLPEKLALVHFDAAVNHGVRRAIKLLQRTVEASPDGVFGNKTMEAVANQLAFVTEPSLIMIYLDERAEFYDRIVDRDPSQSVFLKGWKNRIAKLRTETGVA